MVTNPCKRTISAKLTRFGVVVVISTVFLHIGGAKGEAATTKGEATSKVNTTFDPRNFSQAATGANKWFPLQPGYQSVREGALNRGHRRLSHRRVYTVRARVSTS